MNTTNSNETLKDKLIELEIIPNNPQNARQNKEEKQSSKLGSRDVISRTALSKNNSLTKDLNNDKKELVVVEAMKNSKAQDGLVVEEKLVQAAINKMERQPSKNNLKKMKNAKNFKTQADNNEPEPHSEKKDQKKPNKVQIKTFNDVQNQPNIMNTHSVSQSRRMEAHECLQNNNHEDMKTSRLRKSRSYKLTRRSESKGQNNMTQSQMLLQREYLYLQEFDELNYLEQKLIIVEADKLRCKQKWKELEHEAEEIKSQIHVLKCNKDLDKLSKPSYITADNLSLIRTINAEKRKREEEMKKRIVKQKEKHLVNIKELEERERLQREQMLIDKRNKMKENINCIRKRGESRKTEVSTSNRLVKDLLKSTNNILYQSDSQNHIRISNLYKF